MAPSRPRPTALTGSIRGNRISLLEILCKTSSYTHLVFDLQALQTFTNQISEKPLPLLPKRQSRLARHIRHTFFNVYRRLFTVVFILNLLALSFLLGFTRDWVSTPPLTYFAAAAATNITLAILIRQDYIVNTLFKIAWLVPLSAPLALRSMLAKIYEFGGVHSGAAICCLIWFTLLTVFLTMEVVKRKITDIAVLTVSYLLLALLSAIIGTAYPIFRFKSHNTFENVHRWIGWLSLALFWAEVFLFARLESTKVYAPLGVTIIHGLPFWLLLIASLHTILPWLRLKRVKVRHEKLSDHVIRIHFLMRVPLFVGLRISESPLGEWHSFACIPSRDGGRSGGSVLISHAGDWTKKTITDPKSHYWVKGIPVTGVLCMARVFRSIVIVTTGSGIGPCLGVMQDIPRTKVRVIWSTRDPWSTYGKEVCTSVLRVDRNAELIDTRFVRRPDLVSIAYQIYHRASAEAVFVISNPKLTKKVVYGMESRGVPAFGPIWDS